MNGNALTKSNGGAIAPFGTRDDIREMTERLRLMLPGVGLSLNQKQILALAQGAVAHGLNPLNGEIWIIVDNNGESRGLQIGIKGLRKKAHEQITANGKAGNFWCEFFEIVDPDTRARWKIGKDDLAFECRLYDSETIRLYVEAIERLQNAKIPWEMVKELVGARPYTTGIGVLKANDKTRMQPVQAARKRAEADAIKQRFDVQLDLSVADDDLPAYPGEWVEGKVEPVADPPKFASEAAPDPAEEERLKADWAAQLKRDAELLYPKA